MMIVDDRMFLVQATDVCLSDERYSFVCHSAVCHFVEYRGTTNFLFINYVDGNRSILKRKLLNIEI